MAKAILNETVDSYRGKIGKLVFRLTPSGTLSVGKVPDMSNVEWSAKGTPPALRAGGPGYKGRTVRPKVKAKYQKSAKKKGKRAFDLAVSDFYHGRNLVKK